MKLAYFGCDLFMRCLDVFQAHGDEVVAIFTMGDETTNQVLRDYAASHNIQCNTEKPTSQHIDQLENLGVQCLFSNQYGYLIPLPSARVMALNMHPTLLPEGRGPTPLCHLIRQYPQHAGITLHKLSADFDAGDIVFQAPLQLAEQEGLESLLIKLHYAIPELLNTVLKDLPRLFQQAKPQMGGSYWPKITLQDRLIDWRDNVHEIAQLIRAFGRFGVVACIGQEAWLVRHAQTHPMQHTISTGTQIIHDQSTCVVAVTGGFVTLHKDSIVERCNIDALHTGEKKQP